MLESLPFIISFTGLGVYLGFLLVTQSRKAPSPKLLRGPIYFYVGALFVSAAVTFLKASGKELGAEFGDVVFWAQGLQLVLVGGAIVKLVGSFEAHREKYSKRKKQKVRSERKKKSAEVVEEEVGFLGEGFEGEIVTLPVEPLTPKGDRAVLDAMIRD